MAIFREEKTVKVQKVDSISISIEHKNLAATESYNVIDIPGNANYFDHEWENEKSVLIGNGEQLIGKSVILYSKAANLNASEDQVKLNYSVNNEIVYQHSNEKKDDPTPTVILTLKFTE